LSGIEGQQPMGKRDPNISAGLLDAANISIRCGIASDLDDRQRWGDPGLDDKRLYLGAQLFAQCFGERAAVEDGCGHVLYPIAVASSN
jgi:hypothetical protein